MALANPAGKAEGSESPSGAMDGPKTRGKDLANIKGRARANLGDTMYTPIRVANLGGRISKWAKTDEKL